MENELDHLLSEMADKTLELSKALSVVATQLGELMESLKNYYDRKAKEE